MWRDHVYTTQPSKLISPSSNGWSRIFYAISSVALGLQITKGRISWSSAQLQLICAWQLPLFTSLTIAFALQVTPFHTCTSEALQQLEHASKCPSSKEISSFLKPISHRGESASEALVYWQAYFNTLRSLSNSSHRPYTSSRHGCEVLFYIHFSTTQYGSYTHFPWCSSDV